CPPLTAAAATSSRARSPLTLSRHTITISAPSAASAAAAALPMPVFAPVMTQIFPCIDVVTGLQSGKDVIPDAHRHPYRSGIHERHSTNATFVHLRSHVKGPGADTSAPYACVPSMSPAT